jgi:hypothetical protein
LDLPVGALGIMAKNPGLKRQDAERDGYPAPLRPLVHEAEVDWILDPVVDAAAYLNNALSE